MDTPERRLETARIAAGYKTATEAAGALKVSGATYLAHENGSRGLGRSAARYAAFYHVRLEWLLEGRGPMKVGQKDPILELYDRIPAERRDQAIEFWEYLARQK